MDSIREFFSINRTIVFFVYGLTFFVTGLAIFLQSRRHSRLRLARDLYWLAAFGLLHGIHEWGTIFIPIQEAYLPDSVVDLLETAQVILLAGSFVCLLIFGAVTLERRFPELKKAVLAFAAVWLVGFFIASRTVDNIEDWHRLSTIWARYLLALPGSLLAAYGLRYQVQTSVMPLTMGRIYNTFQIAGIALVAYAILAGLVVQHGNFFPANRLNYRNWENTFGVPVQVLRSLIGLVLVVTIIRALEIFEIELDRLIEQIEVERVQSAERERIGQDIHDGAMQGIYSAGLILDSMDSMLDEDSATARRLQQAKHVLNAVNTDLRRYMVSLRTESRLTHSSPALLIAEPRFHGLLNIHFTHSVEPSLKPMQVHHALAIVQEALSNALRHARARNANVSLHNGNHALRLEVSDDGRGFDTQSEPGSYGMRSMRDRARLLGGRLDIRSEINKGTTVTLTLPEEKIP